MTPTNQPPLDDALLERLDAFESLWQQGNRPSLDCFLAPAGHSQAAAYNAELLLTDLEWRIRAGDAAPLAVSYFSNRHILLVAAQELELLRAEYQFRWQRGDLDLKRSDYQEWFPDHAAELATLTPRWDCPKCKLEGIALADETAAEGVCPRCNYRYQRQQAVGAERRPAFPQIPGYHIDSVLGEGGLGIVYRARATTPGDDTRLVALKMLRQDRILAEALTRMEREADIWQRLNHPGIVRLLGRGEHRGLPFLAIELVPGLSLDRRLQGRPQAATVAARIVRQIAEAVQHAHSQGIIHRDLKPGNVLMLGGEDQALVDCVPRVTDFGLAKRLGDASDATRTSAVFGTPAYMAPEQARSAKQVDARTDIYALGAILYELLTGRPPFQGADFKETLQQVLFEEPLSPRRLVPSVPRDLETVCLKCLEKVPADRYATAEQLGQDLQRFLDGKRPVARPPSLWRRGKRWAKRNRTVATAAAGSALLLVLVVGVGFLYQQGRLLAAEQGERKNAEAKAEAEKQLRELADRDREVAELDAAKRKALAETIVRGIPLPDPLGLNGYSFPVSERYGERLPFKDVIVRAEQIGRQEVVVSQQDKAVRATVLDNLGNAYRNLGYYDQARQLLTEALRLREGAADDLDTAESLFHLAILYHEGGDYARADGLYLKAFDLRRRHLAEDDDAVTEILYHRAWLYLQDEDFQKSTALFEEVLRLRTQRHGANHPQVLRAQMGLDAIPGERGHLDESLMKFVSTIARLAQQSGDPELILAVRKFIQGEVASQLPFGLAEGLANLKDAFDHIRRTDYLGPTHLYAAFIAARLAELYIRAGDDAAAEQWYRQASAILDGIDELGQGKTPALVGNFARLLNRRKQRPEAEQLFQSLLVAQRAHFRSRRWEPTPAGTAAALGNAVSPSPAGIWNTLVLVYRDTSPDHFAIATALREYAKVLGEWGEVRRQEETLREALHILEQTGGVRRQHFAPCLLDLAYTRLRQGDVAGAMVLLDRARDAERQWLERREQLQQQIRAVRARAAATALVGSGGWPW